LSIGYRIHFMASRRLRRQTIFVRSAAARFLNRTAIGDLRTGIV
jgi:hypothetical protein